MALLLAWSVCLVALQPCDRQPATPPAMQASGARSGVAGLGGCSFEGRGSRCSWRHQRRLPALRGGASESAWGADLGTTPALGSGAEDTPDARAAKESAARLKSQSGWGTWKKGGLEEEQRTRAEEKIKEWRRQTGDQEAERAKVERMVLESSEEVPDDGSDLLNQVLLEPPF